MNTQNLSTLQVFQLLSRKCKSHFLQSCPKEFIRFLCECIVNLLKGKFQAIKRHHVVKFQRSLATIAKKNNLEAKKKRSVVRKGLQLIAVITPPVINHLS